jgi:hypothetical protein
MKRLYLIVVLIPVGFGILLFSSMVFESIFDHMYPSSKDVHLLIIGSAKVGMTTVWGVGVIAPMVLLWRMTMRLLLKENLPYRNITCLLIYTIFNNGWILIGLSLLSKSGLEEFEDMPALVWWSASFVSCALTYWYNLRISKFSGLNLRLLLRGRTILAISLFMSAIQLSLYAIMMKLLSLL